MREEATIERDRTQQASSAALSEKESAPPRN